MKITSINREACPLIRRKVEEALAPIGEELGLKFRMRNMSFSFETATGKLEISTINQDGSVNTPEAQRFKQGAWELGLQPDDLGQTFITDQGSYRITGMAAKVRKYPIFATEIHTGGRFKFSPISVQRGLERAREKAKGAQ